MDSVEVLAVEEVGEVEGEGGRGRSRGLFWMIVVL